MQFGHWAFAAILSLSLSGCAYDRTPDPELSSRDAEFMALMPKGEPGKEYLRYMVNDPTGEAPGTIVVETKQRMLYFVLPNKKAMRYGVALGRESFGWTGEATIHHKAEWPTWNPPAEMIERWPHVHKVEGGPNNPMGARAMYLYQGDKDTLYRIHGTNEPLKIGKSVSSGCIRMLNIDVIDLYNRVSEGTRVIVR